MPAESKIGLNPVLEDSKAKLRKPCSGNCGERHVHEVGQRRSAPEAECLMQQSGCGGRLPCREGGTTAGRQPLEGRTVHVCSVDGQPVATRLGDDGLRLARRQRPSQPGDQGLQSVDGGRGRVISPDPVDQPVDRDQLSASQSKLGDHRAQPEAREVNAPPAAGVHLDRPEQPNPHDLQLLTHSRVARHSRSDSRTNAPRNQRSTKVSVRMPGHRRAVSETLAAGQSTLWIQPCGSGAAPCWISRSVSRSRIVAGPEPPSPTVHSAPTFLTDPTGVMTAAVPQAKTSLIEPSALPACHSSTLIRPSSTSYPRSFARVRSESRVTPGRSVPVSDGVMTRAVLSDPYTKKRFMPPISSTQRCSIASSQTTWSQPWAAA